MRKELKAVKDLQGYKHVFAVNDKVTKHGLISIGSFGLLSTTIHGNGVKEWYYAVKIGKVVTNGKTQVYKLFVNKMGQITGIAKTEYFVKVKKEINWMDSYPAQVYSVNGIVAEHGLETKIFGSTMFGLLEPDALYGDGQYEWTYGVEIGEAVANGKAKVYKLSMVSDVITQVEETEYMMPVKPLLVGDVVKPYLVNQDGYTWDTIMWATTYGYALAVRVTDEIISESNKQCVCPQYELIWTIDDTIGKPSKITRYDTAVITNVNE